MLQPSAEVTQDYVLKSCLIGDDAYFLRNNILDVVAWTLLYNSSYYLGTLRIRHWSASYLPGATVGAQSPRGCRYS